MRKSIHAWGLSAVMTISRCLEGILIDQRTGISRPATLTLSCGVRLMSPACNNCVCPRASIQVPVR
ncbi:hypothetical protein D3C81_971570 [compost metagenome]